jgi:hypothetical protein
MVGGAGKYNISKFQNIVIPAQAGTQSFVHLKPTNVLGPGLRRGDESLRFREVLKWNGNMGAVLEAKMLQTPRPA